MKIDKHSSIYIKDLSLRVIIGTQPFERKNSQDIIANIELVYDASLAAQTDALEHAVDYSALYEKILSKTLKSEFFLLEKLAGTILEVLMDADARISSAHVSLEKRNVLKQAKAVIVSLSASRQAEEKTIRCY